MRMDEMIGLYWDEDLNEIDVIDATGAALIEVIDYGAAAVLDLMPGRTRIWLTEDDQVWKITNDEFDGSVTTVEADADSL